MFGFLKKSSNVESTLNHADVYDIMLYKVPEGILAKALPTVIGFRVKEEVQSPDPRPSFVLLESDEEIQEWRQVLAGPVSWNDDGHITETPLLQWNNIPSLLTGDVEIVATYFPERESEGWPPLALQAHPFDAMLEINPARDRYYFEQDMIVAIL